MSLTDVNDNKEQKNQIYYNTLINSIYFTKLIVQIY